MPRYQWMEELVGNIRDNIGKIFEYAKINLRTLENYKQIKEITNIIKREFI